MSELKEVMQHDVAAFKIALLYRSCHSEAERGGGMRHPGAREPVSDLNGGKQRGAVCGS